MIGSSNRTIIQTQTSKTTQKWVTEHKTKLLLWREEAQTWSCESEDLEWFWMKEWSLISCQVFSDLNPVEDEWGELKRRICESEDLEWFWMKEWSLISCQVFSDLNPVEDEWGELKRRICESEDLEWFWMKEWSLISCQVFSDLNPVEDEWVNWRGEAVNLKIWSDSGWRNGLWSRVRCSLTSSGIIGENAELLNWQMEVSKSIK